MIKPFESLTISRQTRYNERQKESHRLAPKLSYGWDTETYEGRCHLIAVSDASGNSTRYHYIPLYPKDEAEEAHRLFKFILNMNRGWLTSITAATNFFYNLDYDVRAILRWLPPDLWYDVSKGRKVEYLGFTFRYLPSKVFTIGRGRHSISFFDMQQFYGKSLDYNARKYLNMNKTEGIDAREIGTQVKPWIEERDKIIEYCLMDCKILAGLADYFNEMLYKALNFSSKSFYSTGSLAQDYYLTNAFIPQIHTIPRDVLAMHWNSYRGGRVEILQRGTFPKVYEMDIKSAYPAQMANLLDYSQGIWESTGADKYTTGIEAGIYRINLSWNFPKIAPFPRHMDNSGVLYYPIQLLNHYDEYIVNEKELEFLTKHDDKCHFEVIEGREFYSYHEKKPFEDTIHRLFSLKEETNDEMERHLYKLLLNSAYGKTAQALPIDDDSPTKRYRTGRLWNPIYASRITSLTRLQLLEAALPMIDTVVGLATDAIHTTTRPYIRNTGKLGSFELSGKGEEALVLMAGVRQVGNIVKGRGFSIPKGASLIELARPFSDKKEFPVYFERPLGIFRALQSNRIQEMNNFVSERKLININGDMRRLWKNDFKDVSDALTSNMTSFALPSTY